MMMFFCNYDNVENFEKIVAKTEEFCANIIRCYRVMHEAIIMIEQRQARQFLADK